MLRGRGQERYIFADCAINPDPDKDVLAEIAIESAKTAKMFDIDPKVALLSFSTKGSAGGDQVDKVAQASEIVKEKDPDLAVDGELQFDEVFVFPELQSGNIGYKIAQRFGNFEAIGPVLQGLNKPISDLSRGCSSEDVYNLSLVTATQAIAED